MHIFLIDVIATVNNKKRKKNGHERIVFKKIY